MSGRLPTHRTKEVEDAFIEVTFGDEHGTNPDAEGIDPFYDPWVDQGKPWTVCIRFSSFITMNMQLRPSSLILQRLGTVSFRVLRRKAVFILLLTERDSCANSTPITQCSLCKTIMSI